METRNERTTPFMATHVGCILKEELQDRGIKQKDFARQIELQPSHLSELLKGKRNLTPSVAERIEAVLGIPAKMLMKVQSNYDYDVKVIQQRKVEDQEATIALAEYEKVINLKHLWKRLDCADDWALNMVAILRNTLKLPSPAEMQVQPLSGYFRKANLEQEDLRNIRTWVLLARLSVASLNVEGTFSRDQATECGKELVKVFNENKDVILRTQQICSAYGIRFTVCESLPKTRIDGFSFVENGIPSIVLTNRLDRIDSMAFNVLHELGHLALSEQSHHINLEHYSKEDPEERQADTFANEILLPKSTWSKSPKAKMNARVIQTTFTKWADELGINKWIVLGRISFETGIYAFTDPKRTRTIK